MCGINLCYGESNINKMNDSLADNSLRSNYVKLDNSDMYLGRVRLHAMGANKKHDQPIARGNYIGAMIGEIFNYKKIDPTAKTDLQVLIDIISKHGVEGFKLFNGSWAAILYDDKQESINIFTNRLAKKPLYMRVDNINAYSSEIKTLAGLGQNTSDKLYFSAKVKGFYCSENRTAVNEIKRIPPGMHVVLDNHGNIISAAPILN